jgi:hypothetical protein
LLNTSKGMTTFMAHLPETRVEGWRLSNANVSIGV